MRDRPKDGLEVGPDFSVQNEEALLDRLLAGDEEAFSCIVGMYSAPMARVARKFVPSSAVAEEVVQDTWLAVLNGLSRFEHRSSLKTWIFQILVNQAKNHGNRQRRLWWLERPTDADLLVIASSDEGEATAPCSPTGLCDEVADRVILDEVLASVRASIATMPWRQACVISLRDISGLSAPDVCEELGLSHVNQRALLHRARTRIRRDLERLGHERE